MGVIPRVHVFHWRIHSLAAVQLLLEEALELEEVGRDQHILEVRQPALMQRVNLKLEQLLLLVGQSLDPCFLVEIDLGLGLGFGRAKEGCDAAIDLGLFGRVGSCVCCLALETHGGECEYLDADD